MKTLFLTVQEVADALRLHHHTVRRLIKLNQLRAVKIAGCLRVAQSDLDAFLAEVEVKRPVAKKQPAHESPARLPGNFKYL